ncbi:hypothetical protein CVD28_05385 [Bacillus sp. M6-12]|uniref:IclR family transcriptional regulator n=1 Tax=Bacillus sp. M6-12 TaxID=2054166 RepID=UPI000C76CD9C|nr:IclR family transcriptional regulator [Bacillus sp. M6-12]PLS18572.1 hypothetical protein CVD28_05385 [Bacillus sp. M6-12]
MEKDELKGNGIQSLELGIDILKKIADVGRPIGITEIANICEMSKSKLHRYLTSFCRTGFLEKNADLRYSIGSELILLGLKGYKQMDINDVSAPYLIELKEVLNETVALAIWGNRGPFFTKWEESNHDIMLGIRVGSQVSVTRSATGKIFSAFLQNSAAEKVINMEIEKYNLTFVDFDKEMEEIRKFGYSTTQGGVAPGIEAISGPIFNQNSELVAAVTVVGFSGILDCSPDSKAVRMLLRVCLQLSKYIGYDITHDFYREIV